ncbi:ankyrin repeat-containing domain protein [Chaetomium strumarium]|uniref:Ankyrin repeat-containing domain protein n=1 Tax=Chaetomium strumarium TaxID=1170767 RepID=A0AAJ0M299_9PEZI|nr:ankyrin repeat-containing domain protein [Chaetomium strumarium]
MAPHSLTALPIELLVFVIDNLERVEDIAALALTDRRLYSTANPLLYRRAVECNDARPVAWAAHRGLVATLKMALAAGADPCREFSDCVAVEEWERATAAARTAARAGREKEAWAMWDHDPGHVPVVAWCSEPDDDSDHASTPASSSSSTDHSSHAPSGSSDQESDASSPYEIPSSQRSDVAPATVPANAFHPNTVSRWFYAMHLAARGGHDEIIKILLSHGASVDVPSRHFCACTPVYGILNALECPDQVEDNEPPLWSPLHVAICHGRTETAKLLLSRKASPLMQTPLDSRYSFDRDSREPTPFPTALHHAAGRGLTELVRYILDNKIQTDVNVQDLTTLTPFYYAYAHRRWDSTVPLLLSLGANIDCETKMYIPYTAITPLGEACRLGDFAVADRLIDLGADVKRGFIATTSPGGCLTPLHMCCMRSAQAVGEPKEKGEDDEARGRARMRTIEKLVRKGAQLDARDCFGSTPLMAAVQSCNTFALEALSLAGADVDEDEYGERVGVGKRTAGRAVLSSSSLSSKRRVKEGGGVVRKPVTASSGM